MYIYKYIFFILKEISLLIRDMYYNDVHDYLQVYVPYCTSDVYTGRREAGEESGGYTFHGKYVLEAVIEDLLKKVIHSLKK